MYNNLDQEFIMRMHFKALESYGADNIASQASVANRTDLIQMLLDGLLESLSTAKGHLSRGNIKEKGEAISRASRIVLGLQESLDFTKGGELAQNLSELYMYATRRLVRANATNDASILEEIHGLMSEIRSAWQDVPALMAAQTAAGVH